LQTQIESHLNLALRGLEATQQQVQELVTVVKNQSQQIERQSQQIERLMSKDKEQSEKMDRLMSSVQDQPPQRERRGPINQIFPTPFEWKIPNVVYCSWFEPKRSLVSQPFYLFSCGYKYLLKLEITALSRFHYSLILYIKVIPGEFDESLSWPCKEKVCVMLVYQNPLPGKRENMSQVIDFEKEPCSRPLHDDYHKYRYVLESPVVLNSRFMNDTTLIRVN